MIKELVKSMYYLLNMNITEISTTLNLSRQAAYNYIQGER